MNFQASNLLDCTMICRDLHCNISHFQYSFSLHLVCIQVYVNKKYINTLGVIILLYTYKVINTDKTL